MSAFRHLAHVPSFQNNPIVFFTVCTEKRRKILAHPECHKILQEVWEGSADKDGWWVGHYILMPDHVHFFARPQAEARPMAKWMEMWKSVSARQIAVALEIQPPVWQAEYFDRYLRTGESYSEKWAYVEQNAVRAGLVESVEDWPYRGVIHEFALLMEPARPRAEGWCRRISDFGARARRLQRLPSLPRLGKLPVHG